MVLVDVGMPADKSGAPVQIISTDKLELQQELIGYRKTDWSQQHPSAKPQPPCGLVRIKGESGQRYGKHPGSP